MKTTFTIFSLIFLITIIYCFYVYLKRQQYTRERFAFAALTTLSSMTILVLTSIKSSFMPWNFGIELFNYITGKNIQAHQISWPDYCLLIIVYWMGVQAILSLHRNWDGLKSYDQYQREQRSLATGIITEGFGEIHRLARKEPPPAPFTQLACRNHIDIEPATDSLAWKDQARELLRLSSSSYVILPTSWHDNAGYWVGKNMDYNSDIFLFPAQETVTDKDIHDFVDHTSKFTSSNNGINEYIVAVHGSSKNRILKYNGNIIKVEGELTMLSKLVDFTDYKNNINQRVIIDNLPDSDFKLIDVYVPARFEHSNHRDETNDNGTRNIEDFLKEWLDDVGGRQIALLGEYGQGKSTSTLMFTYHLLKESNTKRIPLLIELRGTSPRNLTPLQLLGAWASQYNLNPQALLRLHIAGKLILIFEGFDEMALVGDSEMRLNHFRTIWEFCYPKAKILITGRPNFFLDEEEMKAALGIMRLATNKPHCEAIRLLPFSLNEIEKSLRNSKINVREQICGLVKINNRFKELVSRPSLLHIVSTLWETEKLYDKIEQLNSAFVMDLFVRHSYRRQGLKESASRDFMALNTAEREYFMSGIATYMAANFLPNQISTNQLNILIEVLLKCIPDSISTNTSLITGEIRAPLKERLEESEHGIEHVKTDVRACGILVDDPSTPGTFKFGHKSFMEYLLASVVSEKIIDRNSSKANAIFKATEFKLEDVIYYPVSVEFLSEILIDGFNIRNMDGNNEKILAIKVLNSLLSDNITARFFEKIMIFEQAYSFIIKIKYSKITGAILSVFTPAYLLFAIFSLFILFFKSFIISDLKIVDLNLLNNFATFSIFIATIITFISFDVSSKYFKRKMMLWLRLCTALNINCAVMHKIMLTCYIPWIKSESLEIAGFQDENVLRSQLPER